MKILFVFAVICAVSGCSSIGFGSHQTYSDVTGRTNIPGGTAPVLLDTKSGNILVSFGYFSTSSIWVAYPNQLPDTVIVAWKEENPADNFLEHRRLFALRPLLPPIDPRKQKYHLQFWFHPGDSLDVKVDVLDIGDCEHTHGIGKTRTPHHGPCGVMNDW
jgi:hypothetical protein